MPKRKRVETDLSKMTERQQLAFLLNNTFSEEQNVASSAAAFPKHLPQERTNQNDNDSSNEDDDKDDDTYRCPEPGCRFQNKNKRSVSVRDHVADHYRVQKSEKKRLKELKQKRNSSLQLQQQQQQQQQQKQKQKQQRQKQQQQRQQTSSSSSSSSSSIHDTRQSTIYTFKGIQVPSDTLLEAITTLGGIEAVRKGHKWQDVRKILQLPNSTGTANILNTMYVLKKKIKSIGRIKKF